MKPKIIANLLIYIFIQLPSFSQNTRLLVTNYTNKEYGQDHSTINYSIILDDRDILYAGNANGILEYDGVSWRFITVGSGAYVTSFSKDPYGTLFVGSKNEFGFLAPDIKGSMNYYSLSDSLPEKDRFFSTIWKSYVLGNKVYFQAEKHIFIYDKGKLDIIYPETSFHTSFVLNNKFYVRERHKGLIDYTSGEPNPLPGGEYFSNLGVFAMLPVKNSEKIFIATQEQGFFIIDPKNIQTTLKQVKTTNDTFIIQAGIYGGLLLEDGNYAFNTFNEGIIITDQAGNILKTFNIKSGLPVNDVKQIYQDKNKNIWCALNNGISRIDYSSPLSFYKEESGIHGSVRTIIRYNHLLYIGTTNGLYIEKTGSGLTGSLEFSPIPGFLHQVWELKEIDGNLIVGTDDGLFMIRDNAINLISKINSFTLSYLPEKNWLFVGGQQGLSLFQTKPSWKLLKDFRDIREDIKLIAERKKSYYKGTELWLGTSLQGVIKVILQNDLSHITFKYIGEDDGLNEGWILPFISGDSVIFGTRTGIFIFNDEELLKSLLPDSLLYNQENYKGYFEGSNLLNHPITEPVYRLLEDQERIWLSIKNEIGFIPKSQTDTIISTPFKGIDMGPVNYMYPDINMVCWFAADNGLIRFEYDDKKNFSKAFNVLIRRVDLPGDSVAFEGTYYQPSDDPVIPFRIVLEQPTELIAKLAYKLNDIRFQYAAPFFDYESKTVYSYFLEGYNETFSSWSNQTFVNYTNLRQGEYIFRVKAKNNYGYQSNVSWYAFKIQKPWYFKWWAFVCYLSILLFFVYMIYIQLYNRQLRIAVNKKTAEVILQKNKIEQQNIEIQDSINYARKIQTAVLPSTEMLNDIFSEHFILYKPKDIVSGDFYWLKQIKNFIVVVTADCTGHGIPGAFMSMLGISMLNDLVSRSRFDTTGEMLDRLRQKIKDTLKQKGKSLEQRDGMDLSFAIIDSDSGEMQYSGAYNSIYIIRKKETEAGIEKSDLITMESATHQLIEIKGDKQPIAIYSNEKAFKTNLVKLKHYDTLYMTSDGYPDQIGGPRSKKFMIKKFKELLLTIQVESMDNQKKILDKTINDWKQGVEQLDDILVFGIKWKRKN